MSFVFFAWVAAIFYALTNVVGKLASKYSIQNIWLFNFTYAFFTLFFTIFPALKNGVGLPISWSSLIIASVFNVLFLIFYTLSLFNLDVSVMGPLFNFRTAFGVILSMLLLGESLTWRQILLVFVIFIAGMFVSMDEKLSISSFFKKSILYGILMSLFLALSSIFINKAVAESGYWETNLFSPIITQIILLFSIPYFYKDIAKINIKQVLTVASMSLFLAAGNIFANWAYSINVSISTIIIALPISMFLVLFLSIVKPNLLEKHSLKVWLIRFSTAFVMFGSAIAISN